MLKRRINMQMKKPSTNPSLSQFGDTFRNGSEVLSKSTATVKKLIANNLKHHLLENDSKNNHTNKNHQSFSFYEGASQDFIPIKNIQDEMIITKDGRYLSVIEILPINFFQKSKDRKASIARSFSEIFQNKYVRWQLKILRESGDSFETINNIKKNCPKQINPSVKDSLNNYCMYLHQLAAKGSIVERFFFIWEYSGLDGVKSREENEIAQAMRIEKASIIQSLHDCGNVCLSHKDENLFISEFLYMYFNRNTRKKESIYERYSRISEDFRKFKLMTGIEKELTYSDLIAPKGLYFINKNYVMEDGLYYGYIGFSSNSWPTEVYTGWLNRFNYGADVDMDIIGKFVPPNISMALLTQYQNATHADVSALYRKGRTEKADLKLAKYQNVKDVIDNMNAGADVYDVCIILTVRATSPNELHSHIREICHDLKRKCHIQPDSCYLCCEDYFRLCMPFLYTSPTFSRLKHNVLSTKLGCFYPFTSLTINDPNGFVLGVTEANQTLSPDNFNTNYYVNANMLILGTTGAGKTYTEELIGHRAFLNGKRCFYIIPKKGYQYKRGCSIVDGLYVQLVPGSKHCINLMEIRPEGKIDLSQIDDDTIVLNESLLAKKITNILLWINVQLDTPMTSSVYAQLNKILISLYASFGITDNNDSIFADVNKTSLKKMPILSDFYAAIPNESLYENIKLVLDTWISGSCKNMNGQTNVDLNNPYIVFDCDEDIIGDRLLPAFLLIAFEMVYSVVKSSTTTRDIIFLDEVWKMMTNLECAKLVYNMIKIIRGYLGSAILATQEMNDFLRGMQEYGESVLNNTALVILLRMNENDLNRVAGTYKLSSDECEKILKFRHGDALVVSNGDKIKAHIIPSKREDDAFKDNTVVA